jgi:Asp-tRNA(Asn)/Glu-tRNA(Gln) amidotransferase A subunit family amidase
MSLAATEAARLLAEREVSSEELVHECLDRIEEREDELRAWAHLDPEEAIAQARARDDETSRGPLHGLPVGVKDVIDTADMPTAYGSPIYAGRRPDRDAACVAWLRDQGAVILGKTVTTEFATYQPPPTVNPHDPQRTPGGSSSGSAAAVADGMVPLAYGTQTAGSVIRPASFCGVVGFKPRLGWHPTDGIKRLSARLDTLGTFGRTVADAALLAGFDPAGDEPRIAWCRTPWGEADDAVREAARRLDLDEIDLPAAFSGLADAQETLMAYDVARNLEREWRDHRELLSAAMREYLERAWTIPREAADEGAALAETCRARLPEVLGGYDALLVPAAAGEAPLRSGGTTGDPLFCRAWTLLGVPAISVPGLTGPAGMPVGAQLVGLDERTLLDAASRVEAGLA